MTLYGKRIDWKAQQNSSGETSEEWWEGGRTGSWVWSSQAQMFWGSRHRLTLLLAPCFSQDSVLGGKHRGTKIRPDSLAGPGTTCEFLSGHAFVVWEPKVLWLSRWITRWAAVFIPHLCCSWFPTDCAAQECPRPGSCWGINPHQSSWQSWYPQLSVCGEKHLKHLSWREPHKIWS